jgi:iron(III) transport system permease protein
MQVGDRGLIWAGWIVLIASAGIVVAVPIVTLTRTSWVEGRGRLAEVLTEPGFGTAVAHSLELSAAVTGLAVPIGVAIALALRDPGLPGRAFWRAAVLVPLLIPDFVLGYSWLRAYARGGLTSELFGLVWNGVQGPSGVAVIVAVSAVPLVYLIITVGLATRAEPITERAAHASGATAVTVLRTITLPLLATPAGFSTITTRIYADLTYSSDPQSFVDATTLAVLLVILTLVVVGPADVLLGIRLQLRRTSTADVDWPIGSQLGRTLKPLGLAMYLIATCGLPLLALVSAAITRAVGVPSTPANWTWDNFRAVLTPRTAQALGRSLLLSLSAASILLILGLITAALGRTRPGRGISVLITLTLVLPGSTVAIGMLLGYGRWLADTVAIILLAYLAKLWALAHRPISAGVDRLPPAGVRAARASGATLSTGLGTVALPLIRPALITAWALCFLTALHEVTMSSLLYGPRSETLAVVVLNSADLGRIGVTAALSVLVTLVVMLPAAALWALSRCSTSEA